MQLKSRGVLVALAVLAMSAIAVSAASAATLPEFKPVPTKKKKFTITSSEARWTYGSDTIVCAKSTGSGEITGATTVGDVIVKYKGCSWHSESATCPVKSSSGGNEEIVTEALHGELGKVGGSVGLLLTGAGEAKKWASLTNTCNFPQGALEGSVAGFVEPVGKKVEVGTLNIPALGIKEITLDSGSVVKPRLYLVAAQMLTETSDRLLFEEAVEVT